MLRFILVPVLALMLTIGHVHAQTNYLWNSAANGNWNIGSNWNPAAIPGALDSVLINATGSNYTVTLSDTQSISNLTINSPNATFSQTGPLNLGGTLTLSSGAYQVQSGGSQTSGINGGQIVTTVGTRLLSPAIAVLNNVTLGNAANPDVITIDNNNRHWWLYGSTDFQPGFVPTVGTNGNVLFGTPRVLNTGFNLINGWLSSGAGVGQTVTLKAGNTITATGGSNYIRWNWNISGTVKTSETGPTDLTFLAGTYGDGGKLTIGATGSVIAGSSSGNANISMLFNFSNTLRIDGTIRANPGGTINIYGGDGGSQVFSNTSQFIADGGRIIIGQNNMNIAGTLTMMNGGTISMPSGTTNFTNNGVINIETPPAAPSPSKMEAGSTPESTIQNPGTINISVGSTIQVGGTTTPGTINSGGTTTNNGTIIANVNVPAGGTVDGGGTIAGTVIIAPLGLISPGNSPGKMTLQNGLTLSGQYRWELGSNTESGPGVNFDQLAVTARNVVINSTATLNLFLPAGGTSDPFWESDHSWQILDNLGAGTTSGFFDPSQIIGGVQSNGEFTTSLVGNDVFLNWTAAVPEPSTWALIALTGLGGGCIYRQQRIKRRKQFEACI